MSQLSSPSNSSKTNNLSSNFRFVGKNLLTFNEEKLKLIQIAVAASPPPPSVPSSLSPNVTFVTANSFQCQRSFWNNLKILQKFPMWCRHWGNPQNEGGGTWKMRENLQTKINEDKISTFWSTKKMSLLRWRHFFMDKKRRKRRKSFKKLKKCLKIKQFVIDFVENKKKELSMR